MYLARLVFLILLSASLTLLVGCGEQRKATSKRPAPSLPETLESASFLDVAPVADGGAYVKSLYGRVWYVRQGKGVKVTGLPENMLLAEIIPAAEGGAYLKSLDKGLWYLSGDGATKVSEVQSLSDKAGTEPREKWLWALLQREIARRHAAEESREPFELTD